MVFRPSGPMARVESGVRGQQSDGIAGACLGSLAYNPLYHRAAVFEGNVAIH